MIEFIQNFHFLRPWLLLFLFIPLILYIKKRNKSSVSSSWEDICDRNLLNYLLVTGSGEKKISAKKLIYIGLITATIAAAGPAWKKENTPSFTLENPVMFILSLAQDMQLTDITPSRLNRAKYVISDISEQLPQGQFGIEVYSQEPYIITPFTDDAKLIKNILPQIVPDIVPDQGDRLDRAIDLASQSFNNAGYYSGNIIVLASDVGQRFDLALDAVKKANNAKYIVNIIDTSPDGNEKLKLLADTGHGLYMNVQVPTVEKLIQNINIINSERIRLNENMRAVFTDYGYYLLFIPMLCLLLFFRKGMLVLFFLLYCQPAFAGFLLNNNQEGLKYFNNKQYEEAFKKFNSALWRGIILYQQENLEEAIEEFSKENSADSLYNKGVALAKLCRYEEAIEAFDASLELNTENEDARYNKRLISDLLEKAKDDPSLLNCSDNQEQDNQENSEDSEQNENSQDSEENDTSSNENQENNETESQNQENNNNQQQPDDDKNPENSEDNSQQGQDARQNSSEEDSPDAKQEQQKDNDSEEESNGKEQERETEQPVTLANTQEGNDNDYDEEALALQRKYREIPEDPGGLLREFIRKEYLKDRYNDE